MRHAAIAVLSLLLVAPAAVSAASDVRLNEFMAGPATDWNGSGSFSSRDDEWVEVVNTGAAPAELGGLFLTDGGDTPRFRMSGLLAPGERLVIFGSDAYDWERANGFPAFGLSLGNSGDEVKLWEIAAGDTMLIDSYAYGSHAASADRALGRSPDGTGGWALFDGLNPYAGSLDPPGTGCMPTPDAANVCGSTPVTPMTWGRVKALYRKPSH